MTIVSKHQHPRKRQNARWRTQLSRVRTSFGDMVRSTKRAGAVKTPFRRIGNMRATRLSWRQVLLREWRAKAGHP